MIKPAARLLALSPLASPNTPAEHFRSIIKTSIVIHEETRVRLTDPYKVTLSEDVYNVTLEDDNDY